MCPQYAAIAYLYRPILVYETETDRHRDTERHPQRQTEKRETETDAKTSKIWRGTKKDRENKEREDTNIVRNRYKSSWFRAVLCSASLQPLAS